MLHHHGPYDFIAPVVLFTLISIEALWDWRTRRGNYNLKESATNSVILVGYAISKYFAVGYSLLLLGFFSQFAFWQLPRTFWVFAVTLFATDFCYYWYHRFSHTNKLLWAFHVTHHSSQWMNFTTAYRINWFSSFITPFFFIPLALLGLPPLYIVLSFSLNLVFQFFLHTEAVGKIPIAEGIIDTPSAHRVHHGSNDIYIDKNYGGILMLWDRLFGTYQPETVPIKYGVTT
ncbi:MAG TPA: sterol desaturase family protein, partial [Chitinophagales bacterium]|nr:sterol desaturase family protein [Chitinophagales bacterium]